MKQRRESVEAQMVRTAGSIGDPLSRRIFMQLMGAAGISLGAKWTGMIGEAAAEGVKRGKIAYQIDVLHQYWVQWEKGFDGTTAALALEPAKLFHGSDPARQIGQVRSLKASGVNMFVALPFPDGAVPQIAKICNEAGIYYSNIWEHPAWYSPADAGDFFVNYSTPDSVKAGREVAEVLFKAVGGEGKIVHITGLPTPTDSFRTAGIEQALEKFPGIELVGKIRGNWTEEGGRSAMLSMMTAHPDMKGVFAQNDSIAAGVLSVLVERGRKDIPVVGVDGLPAGLEQLAAGGQFIATHTSLPPYQAAWQIVSVFDAMNGWKPSLPERMTYTGSVLATAENAQFMLDRLYGTEPAFDWVKMSRTLNPETWDPQIDIVPIDPEKQWALFPENKDRLNPAYATAREAGEFEKVTQLYADHYKTGPFK